MVEQDNVTNSKNKIKKFKLLSLRNNTQKLFRVDVSVFDAVTMHLDANAEYSVKEIKILIDKWLGKKV